MDCGVGDIGDDGKELGVTEDAPGMVGSATVLF